MAGCEYRTDIEIEGGVDGLTVNAQMRLNEPNADIAR